MAPQHYTKDGIPQFYYSEIKNQDPIAVDSFWLNLLPDYFRKSDKFGIEIPPTRLCKQEAYWTTRYIRNGDLQVVLVQDRSGGGDTQRLAWQDALEQLTRHLLVVRKERNQIPNVVLYGVTNIGTFTRFHQLHPDDDNCIDFVSETTEYKGQQLELLQDEVTIHLILTELVEKTKKRNSKV